MIADFYRVRIPQSAHNKYTLLSLVKPIQSDRVGVPIAPSLSIPDRAEMVQFIESLASERFTRIPDKPSVAEAALVALRFLGFNAAPRILDALEESVRRGTCTAVRGGGVMRIDEGAMRIELGSSGASGSGYSRSAFMLPVFIKACMYEVRYDMHGECRTFANSHPSKYVTQETFDMLRTRFGVRAEDCSKLLTRIRAEGLGAVLHIPCECREFDGPWDNDMLAFGWMAANHMYTGDSAYATAMVLHGTTAWIGQLCSRYGGGKAVGNVPLVSRFCDELAEILRFEYHSAEGERSSDDTS